MGALAQALKRKLGGGEANGVHKRPHAAIPPPQAVATEAPPPTNPSEALRQQLANGGFAALIASCVSTDTRTARRKQRKVERLAQQQAREDARLQREKEQQRHQHGNGSDSEADSDLWHGATNAQLQLGEEAQHEVVPAAYTRLLGSLRASGGAHAAALQQRQREQAGDSEASEEEEEEEEDSEDEELESLSGSEQLGNGHVVAGGDDEAGDAEEAAEAAAAANGQAGGTEDQPGSGSASESESEAGSGEEGEAAAAVGKQRRHLGDNGAAETTDAHVAPEDHYLSHFDRELSEEQAAELQQEGRRCEYLNCCTQPSGGSQGGEQGPAVAADVAGQWQGAVLQAIAGTRLPQAAPSLLSEYGVKERLVARWREVAPPAANSPCGDFADEQQRALFALLNCYPDLLLPSRGYPTSTADPDPQLDVVLLHLLSHCAKAAARIKKNNEKLKAQAGSGAASLDAVPRDQGFTRAKVLLLVPQRNMALRVVSRLVQLAVKETRTDSVQNKQRFLEEFGDEGEQLSEREAAAVARKPADHQALFSGNMDDHFRLGIKLTRGAVKLFADFFDSDIVVASPLALATTLAEAGGEGEGAADFLSSVEVVVVERGDVMLMQNWAHVVTVFGALNRIPREGHGVDMMRVRDWALSGRGGLYRQTILLSSFASAEMNALMARTCRNHAGRVRVLPAYRGVLSCIIHQARQLFERLPAAVAAGPDGGSIADADARFEHFRRSLWPRMRESGGSGGHLIYLPSYFDYVRVRNFLRTDTASFLGLCEYTERADAARARSYFFDRRKQVLLYTERAQFYNRHRIRGAKHVLFYQLPEHAHFYSELVNLMEAGEAGETPTVTVLFSKVDALRLERVVGGARSAKMLKNRKTSTFLFC